MDRANGAYGSRCHGGYMSNRDGLYSSSGSDKYHGHHCYHPYRKNERGYLPNEFKKVEPPTFDGELKKPEDVEAWFLKMNKFFELHDYTENMKSRIVIFSLKGV